LCFPLQLWRFAVPRAFVAPKSLRRWVSIASSIVGWAQVIVVEVRV
jgi:hypothetical protein